MSTRVKPPERGSEHAFTRLELLASLMAAALLMTILLPALANSTSRADRVACFNNLRQIGAGFTQFGLEHANQMAWSLPGAEGGNRDNQIKNNSFIQFSILSNFIASPKVLMDPADSGRNSRVASSWDEDPQRGLLGLGNNAISYFLGLDGNFETPALPLAGDWNWTRLYVGGCSSGISPASTLLQFPGDVPGATSPGFQIAGWTNAVHGLSGNVLLYDGSVHELDTPGLYRMFPRSVARLNVYHALMPF